MQDIESTKAQYHHVSAFKFSLMVICTFGLYGIYWNYKNWQYIKERDNSRIKPVWRSLFSPLWYYSLLTDLADHSGSKYLAGIFNRGLLAATYLLMTLTARLPDPYWIVGMLAFIPVLPAVQAIAKINSSGLVQNNGHPHSAWNFSAYLLGGPMVLLTILLTVNYIPGASVIGGDRLLKKDLDYLTEHGMLGEGEKIKYFYSSGMWSIEDDGQFITDEYVVAYARDPISGELYGRSVAYKDITDISVAWSKSYLEDTVVTITDTNTDKFELWITPESAGDKRFVAAMIGSWKKAKRKGVRFIST